MPKVDNLRISPLSMSVQALIITSYFSFFILAMSFSLKIFLLKLLISIDIFFLIIFFLETTSSIAILEKKIEKN